MSVENSNIESFGDIEFLPENEDDNQFIMVRISNDHIKDFFEMKKRCYSHLFMNGF